MRPKRPKWDVLAFDVMVFVGLYVAVAGFLALLWRVR